MVVILGALKWPEIVGDGRGFPKLGGALSSFKHSRENCGLFGDGLKVSFGPARWGLSEPLD